MDAIHWLLFVWCICIGFGFDWRYKSRNSKGRIWFRFDLWSRFFPPVEDEDDDSADDE